MTARALVLAVLTLTLAGCRASSPSQGADEPDLSTYPPAAPVECITMSPGAIAGLQWGFDDKQPGFTVTAAAGYDVPQWDHLTLVAAEFSGPGVDSEVGLWATLEDVTTATDAAYSSVDFLAAEFTSYLRPVNAPSSLPEFAKVKECVALL